MGTDVTVVAVTWNSQALVPAFVAGLERGLEGIDHHLVVADNASTDDTVATLARAAPTASVVRLDRNRGYAAGVNAALDVAPPSEAVLVLNPDVRLRPGCVQHLLDALELPGTGITVPRLLEPDGRVQLSLRRDPTVLRTLGAALLGGQRAGRIAALGEVVSTPAAYQQAAVVDWAAGAAWLVSRACLDAVGRWDDSFFLYSEEVDFARRARARGFLVRYAPAAEAVHLGGDMGTSPHLWSMMVVNRVRLFARDHGRLHTAAFWAATLLNEALRAAAGRSRSRAAVRALLTGAIPPPPAPPPAAAAGMPAGRGGR